MNAEIPEIPQNNLRSRLLEATARLQDLLDAGQIQKTAASELHGIVSELKYIATHYPSRREQAFDVPESIEAAAVTRARSEVDSGEFDVQG